MFPSRDPEAKEATWVPKEKRYGISIKMTSSSGNGGPVPCCGRLTSWQPHCWRWQSRPIPGQCLRRGSSEPITALLSLFTGLPRISRNVGTEGECLEVAKADLSIQSQVSHAQPEFAFLIHWVGQVGFPRFAVGSTLP